MAAKSHGFLWHHVSFHVDSVESKHTIFYKQHLVREECSLTPSDRTLFTLGWPPFAKIEEVRQVYSAHGEIADVYLKRTPGVIRDLGEVNGKDVENSYKVAYVVFLNEENLKRVLSKTMKKVDVEVNTSNVGVSKWSMEYMEDRTDVSTLKTSADDFMHEFDKEEAAKKREQEKLKEKDEEGWVTIVRKGKKHLGGDIDVSQNRRKKRKKKNKELLNFYAFQQRESRRDHIAQLRKKFEEDKLRVQAMKQARKFRPF